MRQGPARDGSYTAARLVTQNAIIYIESAGASHQETGIRTTDIQDSYSNMPDVLAVIGEQTLTKRTTVCEILLQSGRLQDLRNNPQLFIERAVEIIRNRRHQLSVDGISYLKLAEQEYYIQEIFDSEELIANLEKNAVFVERSAYDHIIYDSSTMKRPFTLALGNDPDMKMFFKIPHAVKIALHRDLQPGLAVLDRDGEKKLYFVLETKDDTSVFDLRTPEALKIHCGRQHFKALDNGVELRVAKDWKEFRVGV